MQGSFPALRDVCSRGSSTNRPSPAGRTAKGTQSPRGAPTSGQRGPHAARRWGDQLSRPPLQRSAPCQRDGRPCQPPWTRSPRAIARYLLPSLHGELTRERPTLACETMEAEPRAHLWAQSRCLRNNEGSEEPGEVKRQTEGRGSRPQQHPDDLMTRDRFCKFPPVPRCRGHTHACVSTPPHTATCVPCCLIPRQ